MNLVLEMAIAMYILVKMYCIYDDQLESNFRSFVASCGMIASAASLVVSFIEASVVLMGLTL